MGVVCETILGKAPRILVDWPRQARESRLSKDTRESTEVDRCHPEMIGDWTHMGIEPRKKMGWRFRLQKVGISSIQPTNLEAKIRLEVSLLPQMLAILGLQATPALLSGLEASSKNPCLRVREQNESTARCMDDKRFLEFRTWHRQIPHFIDRKHRLDSGYMVETSNTEPSSFNCLQSYTRCDQRNSWE